MLSLHLNLAAAAVAWAALAGAAPPAPAETPGRTPETPRREEIVSKLNNVKISLELSEAPLAEALDFIRSFSGIDFFIDPKVKEKLSEDQLKVTLKVNDLPLKSALKLMLGGKNLTCVYREGVLVVVPKEEADKDLSLRIYDVRDLLMKVEDHAGPVIELKPPSAGAAGLAGAQFIIEDPKVVLTQEFIVDMVKRNCGSESWASNPNATVTLDGGLLMVNQSPRVHAEILRLLWMLRQYK
jgi:hypothetical protein